MTRDARMMMMFEFFKRSAHKYYGESPNFHDKDHSRVILITIADKGEADRNAGTYSTGDKRLSNFGKRVAGFVTKQKYSFKTVRIVETTIKNSLKQQQKVFTTIKTAYYSINTFTNTLMKGGINVSNSLGRMTSLFEGSP